MNKYKLTKRILSVLLAVVLLAGTVSTLRFQQADASQTSYNEVALSLGSESGGAFYLNATLTDGPNKGQVIGSASAYGDWGSNSQINILCDGQEQLVTFSTASEFLYLAANPSLDDYTTIEIKEGVLLEMLEGSKLMTPLKVKSTLKLSKESGTWKEVKDVPKETNKVEISYSNMDENALWLKGTIVDGPNKGALLGGNDAYGDWKTTTGTITVDGSTALEVQASTASEFLYIKALDSNVSLPGATTIEIKHDTIFYPDAGALCTVPIQIQNDLTLEKIDGTWKVKADESEKEVVTDVKITGYEMYPKQEEGFCQIILKTDKNLNALYPDGGFAGEITIGDKKKTVEWFVGDNLIYTVGITYQEFMQAEKLSVKKDSIFTMLTNEKRKLKYTNGLSIAKESGIWIDTTAKKHDYAVSDFEIYRLEEDNCYQLILKFTGDVRKTTIMPLTGSVLLDGKAKEVEWYVDEKNGLFYTVGITLEEGDKAKKIEVAKDSLFTILNDTQNVLRISKPLKITKIDGIWVKDEGQTKLVYNEVKLSYSACDGRGFYLKAEIVAGPDKGKTIGSADVYGDWLSSAAGAITYNKSKSMDVWFSPSADMIYVSGDYDLSKMKTITFKKGTILEPIAGAKYNVMMKLANTLELAKDTRYDRWVLAKDVNKKYTFNDVTVGVTRVTGAVLEMKGAFKNNDKQLKDVYGDWVLLNGAITIGDPANGKYTDGGATWSLAGDMLMLYGISAGLMDSIQIKAGTVLWPDASCKSQTPIRITNAVVMKRNAEDEWVISKGKYVKPTQTTNASTDTDAKEDGQDSSSNTTTGVTIKADDGTTVRLVDSRDTKKELTTSHISVGAEESNGMLYVGIAAGCVILGILAILWIVIAKKRKGNSKKKEK